MKLDRRLGFVFSLQQAPPDGKANHTHCDLVHIQKHKNTMATIYVL